jgi:nucleoside-diphosphate-sugar epimerase
MRYSRILITGATGFIGSRLCEKLTLHYRLPYRALVQNYGRAARIARLGCEMVTGNLADPASLEAALAGCDAVVHLAFGNVRKAEENLLAVCERANVKRFVHFSSMAVHGPTPDPRCAREETATIGFYKEQYSDGKARAEKLVQKAIDKGLPGIILRPTVVYGPHSPFVIRVARDARGGAVSLIDDGAGVCNAVYVDDVCDAVYAALHSDPALGKAMFINADRAVTWRDFNLTFANMVTPAPTVRNFSSPDVRAHWEAAKPSLRSNIAAARQLFGSSDFHDQLATVPALKSAITWTKTNLKRMLSADQVAALKGAGGGKPSPIQAVTWPDRGRLVREDFHVEFSNELAKTLLAWKPSYDFAAGAAMTGRWLEFAGMLGNGEGSNSVRAGGAIGDAG